MNKAQAIADLSLQLSAVTTIERTQEIIRRAIRAAGLSNSAVVDEAGMQALLEVIAAEGGAIQQLAEQLAVQGTRGSGGSTSKTAAPARSHGCALARRAVGRRFQRATIEA